MATAILEDMKLENVAFPPGLKVVSVTVEDYTNDEGETALLVNVLLDAATQQETVTGRDLLALHRAISNWLDEKGNRLFPYIIVKNDGDLPAEDE